MLYYRIPPPPVVSRYVQYYWVGEAWGQGFSHYSVAAGTASFVFHYGGNFDEVLPGGELRPSFTAGLQGQSKTHAQFVTREQVGIFGVELFPGAVPALLSMPATAVSNRFTDLYALLGAEGARWQQQMLEAENTAARVAIATRFLAARAREEKYPYLQQVLSQLHNGKGYTQIGGLAAAQRVSQRQLERQFKETIGFSAKTYARLLRFGAALAHFSGPRSFTDIALESGYFDQAHFNHECREFTGMLPKQYRRILQGFPPEACC